MTDRQPIIGEMEARKLPTRQDKDGNFIISFSVHPDDAKSKPDLLTAAPGTPFAVRYCTVDYDNPEPEAPRPKRERLISERLDAKARSELFQKFMRTEDWDVWSYEDAITAQRQYLGVTSRSECDEKGSRAESDARTLLYKYDAWELEHRYSGNLEREAGKHG